jgi:DNA polymerase bacteriophage-type
MKTFAVDFESYYDKECSVSTLGPRAYFSHPSFDAYLVTVVGDDGFSFVGHPKDFQWELLRDNRVVMHNASFDYALYRFGVEKGWYPDVPFECHCTADMVAYFGLPRSLKEASATLFQIEVSKTTRDNMLGKRWEKMTTEFQEQVKEYALKDAELCLKIWNELNAEWPEHERQISLMNRRIGMRGLPIDEDLLRKNLEAIRERLFEAERSIPWIEDKTPLSRTAINAECRKHGIEPPSSWAKDSEEADKWFALHGAKHLWARAVQDYRRINAFLRKLESFERGTLSGGRYYGGFMYFGANPTGRFSGSGGNLNLQNLPKEEMFGVSFRPMIKAKPGFKLLVADLSQIEVRTLAYGAGDVETMERIRQSDDIYHAFGITLGLHTEEEGPLRGFPERRQLVKMLVLGLGFQMGHERFAKENDIPLDEAERLVNLFRSRMKKTVGFWKKIEKDLAAAHALGVPFETPLPNGRILKYGVLKRMRNKKTQRFQYLAKMSRFGKKRDLAIFPGHLAENYAQALARDVFSDMMLRVEAAGVPIIMHVHDEMVAEVPEAEAEEKLATMLAIMHSPPDWAPDLPVAAEGKILNYYSK